MFRWYSSLCYVVLILSSQSLQRYIILHINVARECIIYILYTMKQTMSTLSLTLDFLSISSNFALRDSYQAQESTYVNGNV